MRVLIVNLPDPDGRNVIKDLFNGAWCRGARIGGTMFPPLPLLYAYSVAKTLASELRFLDAVREGLRADAVVTQADETDVLICHSAHYTWRDDLHLLSRLKSRKPSLRIFLFGNVEPSLARNAVASEVVDALCLQDPERVLGQWLQALAHTPAEDISLDGLITRANLNPKVAEAGDLDELPIPDRTPILGLRYPNPMAQTTTWTTMLTGRGCLHRCSFCNTPGYYEGRYRLHGIRRVLEELSVLTDLGYREIYFRDDLFRVGHQQEFYEAVRGLRRSISFVVNLRADTVDEATIRGMAQAGCHTMKFGVESGDETMLARLQKPDKKRTLETFALCRRYGVRTHAHFMIGLPGETKEQMERTLAFIEELNPFTFSLGLFTPHPGSRLYDELSTRNALPQGRWKEALIGNVSAVEDDELHRLLRKTYLRFLRQSPSLVDLCPRAARPVAVDRYGCRVASATWGERTMKPSVAFSYARLATRLTKLYRRRHDSTYTDVFKLKVFVTKRCNLSCIHCGIGAHPPKDNEEIGTDTLARLWEANPDLQLLSFSGGEPFLRHDLSDIAVSAVETLPHLLALSVNTNGWHSDRLLAFTEEVAPRLVVGQRLFMTVSSDGPREQHGIVRRNERSFERKEESLHALRRLGKRLPALQIRHNININPWNFEAIPAYLHELTERREAYFLSFYSAGSHYEHEPQAYEHQQAFRKRLAEDSGWFDSLPAPRSFLGSWYLHLARRYYAQSVPPSTDPLFQLTGVFDSASRWTGSSMYQLPGRSGSRTARRSDPWRYPPVATGGGGSKDHSGATLCQLLDAERGVSDLDVPCRPALFLAWNGHTSSTGTPLGGVKEFVRAGFPFTFRMCFFFRGGHDTQASPIVCRFFFRCGSPPRPMPKTTFWKPRRI